MYIYPPKNGLIALWPNTRVVKCKYYHKNKVGSIIRSNGAIFYSVVYVKSRIGFNELKYLYSVISVIDKRLPGDTKKWTLMMSHSSVRGRPECDWSILGRHKRLITNDSMSQKTRKRQKTAHITQDIMQKLIERNPPPRGGFLFTMFPHQEPCVRGPPSKDLYQVLRGGFSYTRFLLREHSG